MSHQKALRPLLISHLRNIKVAMEYQVPLVYFTVFTDSTDVFLGSPDYMIGDGQKKLRPSPESLMSAAEWVTFLSSVFFKKHEATGSFGAIYGSIALKNLMPIALARPYSHAKLLLYVVAMSLKRLYKFGHTLVALPFVFDQPLNARLLVEKGLAVEIDRGEDGSYDKNDIAKSLRLAMVSKEGEGLRARAKRSCQGYW
ncbi:hypothetical protein CRYUN_Cryun01aG0225000 [Craigia yunnanensis]